MKQKIIPKRGPLKFAEQAFDDSNPPTVNVPNNVCVAISVNQMSCKIIVLRNINLAFYCCYLCPYSRKQRLGFIKEILFGERRSGKYHLFTTVSVLCSHEQSLGAYSCLLLKACRLKSLRFAHSI